jgi:hypothetical protein
MTLRITTEDGHDHAVDRATVSTEKVRAALKTGVEVYYCDECEELAIPQNGHIDDCGHPTLRVTRVKRV